MIPITPNWNPRLIPERLKEAREAKGFTMTELAEKIELTRQSVSQYELGSKHPTHETMLKIVSALHLPITYFTTERPNGGRSGTVFFRSFMSRKKSDNRQYEIKKQWVGQMAHYFGQDINYPRVDFPTIEQKAGEYTNEELEETAARCRRHWNLGDGPIANVVTLLESKGVIVTRSKWVANVWGYSCWHDDQRPLIFLGESKGSAVRSRFDAAHELAHLLLHDGITPEQLEDSTILKRVEKEANRFAGAFLLPSTSFPFEIFHHNLPHFIELKKRWKTSIAAMITRCEQLGIFDEDRILRLRKQISPYRKSEPLDNSIQFEHPTMLSKAVSMIIDNEVKSASEILSDLRLPPELIADFCGVPIQKFAMPEPASVVVHLRPNQIEHVEFRH